VTVAGSARRLVALWGALVLATCVSWTLGGGHGSHRAGATVGTAIALGIAFGKAHFVGAEFMELRHAPLALRVAFDAWVIVVAAALLGLYLHG